MPPKSRRASVLRSPKPDVAVSPQIAVVTSELSTFPPRKHLESDFDYASRVYATELLRAAHDGERSKMQDRQEKQVAELERLVAALSAEQKAQLLKRWGDMESKQVRELTADLAWERIVRAWVVWIAMACMVLFGAWWLYVSFLEVFRTGFEY